MRSIARLLPLFILSCAAPASTPTPSAADAHADHAAVHGMLLVGDKTLYASHLPMFHAPHDYQAIAEITLAADDGSDVRAQYAQDRADSGTKIYTLVPAPGDLTKMMRDGASFRADLYRGHFERGGVVIASGVTVQVAHVVVMRKFDPQATAADPTSFFAFGRGDDTFVAHTIVAPPDFDEVVRVQLPGGVDATALAGGGVPVVVAGATQPLAENAEVTASVGGSDATLHTATQYYLEFDDLAE